MSIKHFQGTTSKFLGAIREKEPVGPIFFKPYQSPLDILGKTTSIITELAP